MRIYLDHAATTPVHPQVLEAMMPTFFEHFGNPSSIHSYGRKAKAMLNDARDRIATLLHCEPSELIFTSGGTESDNLALLGVTEGNHSDGKHIITTQIEHSAVLQTCKQLEHRGYRVTYVPVNESGRVSVEAVLDAICSDTIMISVMAGNNEVGTLQPIMEIGQAAKERGIVFHTDAVQAIGCMDIDLRTIPVDLMSVSAHKLGGMKGIGLLYVRKHTRMHPMLFGGMQERKFRPGTENITGICGMATAISMAVERRQSHCIQMDALKSLLLTELDKRLPAQAWEVNSPEHHCLPHILNISFLGISTETMLMNLDLEGIAASSGSACMSGSIQTSHVLQAMQLSEQRCASAIRFSFGHTNRSQDVHIVADKLVTIMERLRNKE